MWTGLSAFSVYSTGVEIRQDGWSFGKAINLGVSSLGTLGGVAALGWFGTGAVGAFAVGAAPYVLTTVAIYGIVDFGVTICTGTSLSGWANELF